MFFPADIALVFESMTLDQWRGTYQSTIRIIICWEKVKVTNLGVDLLCKNKEIFIPNYKDGDWRDGKPNKITPGKKLALVRLPALKIEKDFFCFDGYHRMTQLKPRMVILDWIEVSKKSYVYFTDMLNPYWRKRLKI